MRFALATNGNNTRLVDGAAIADEAGELGFDALELGFRTQPCQIAGFRSRLARMPVDSVHAYCPAPIGAPSGHPELYRLCSPDENERALARMFLEKTFSCAADLGAKVVVFHVGYVDMNTLFGGLFTNVRRLRVLRGGSCSMHSGAYLIFCTAVLNQKDLLSHWRIFREWRDFRISLRRKI